MKTCRFCLNQQENGAFCEACGSPLDPDNLDFSENQFPDPTMGAGASGSVTGNTANSMPSGLPDPTQPQQMPQSDPAAPATFAPSQAKTAEDATKQIVFQPVNQSGMPVVDKKVMYSAKQSGQTVYMKKKGSYKPSNGPVNWPAQNVAPNAVPNTVNPGAAPVFGAAGVPGVMGTAAPGGQNPANQDLQSEYKSIHTFALVMFIISVVGMVVCCCTSFLSTIFSLIALLKINSVIKGTASDPQAESKTANCFCWVALVLRIVEILAVFAIIASS